MRIIDEFEDEIKKEIGRANLGNNSTAVYIALDRALMKMEIDAMEKNGLKGVYFK